MLGNIVVSFDGYLPLLRAVWRPFSGFRARLSCGASSFMEDQAVKVVGQISESEFGSGPR